MYNRCHGQINLFTALNNYYIFTASPVYVFVSWMFVEKHPGETDASAVYGRIVCFILHCTIIRGLTAAGKCGARDRTVRAKKVGNLVRLRSVRFYPALYRVQKCFYPGDGGNVGKISISKAEKSSRDH